jgi:RND family efflux transporter MFP subunit
MRNWIIIVVAGAVLLGVLVYAGVIGGSHESAAARPGAAGGGGAFARQQPMTVELASASRRNVAEHLLVVGNLIGAATVDVVPKVAGRLRAVNVRLGDSVSGGQVIAQIEDNEIVEQVKQAEASFEVAKATIRQREADLKFAETSLERSRNLYGRELLPKQTLDDSEARYQAALAQLDLARAQFMQAGSRVEELRITRTNTTIVSPVDGFVGKRLLDPGAFVATNTPLLSVVDIRLVRLVVNLVEKDLRRVATGAVGIVEVDAYPGETFEGRVARIAPVLDPATRTAEIEIEIPNSRFRLKPGMYARVGLTIARRENALVVPRNALIDIGGRRGVFVPMAADPARASDPPPAAGSGAPPQRVRFVGVETGIGDADYIEVTRGLTDGEHVVTTGAAALRDGDPILLASPRGAGGGRREPGSPAPGADASRPNDQQARRSR